MKYQKIYPSFIEKIKEQPEKQRVIISFKNLSDRKKFISKNKKLKIIKKFNLIPSINVSLTKEQILTYDKEKLIKQIEEDQQLYLSMLDVMEILGLNDYKASQISFTGRNVNLGILDVGINNNFPSISNINIIHQKLDNSKKEITFKKEEHEVSHGTIMASIISNQFKNSDENLIGIAPHVKIHDFNVSNSKDKYYFSHILEFFDIIVKEKVMIEVLLISFITSSPSDGKDILSLSCNALADKGIIIVSPAGNFGPETQSIGSPGAAKKVITFGTLEKELTIPEFSGRGPTLDERIKPDFLLPGSKIDVPLSQNFRVSVTGTSVSASLGAGIIALIKEYDPTVSYDEIIKLLEKSSIDLDYDNNAQGYGTLNLPRIFKTLDLYQEKKVPYNNLVKNSLKYSIEFLIILILLFYFFYFFRIS